MRLSDEYRWKPFLYYLKKRWKFFGVCLLLALTEQIVAPMLPEIIPQTWYLRAYLPWNSIKRTGRFIDDKLHIEPDDVRGWRNRAKAHFKTVNYDRFGSRSNVGLAPGASKKLRVIFLGDSRIASYVNVTNDEIVNAYLENESIETLNFSSELYGLDQIYLTLQDVVERFHPQVVVIGIGSDVGELLDCHYLPFMYPTIGLPLLKPRLTLRDSVLEPHIPPIRKYLQQLPANPDLLDYIRQHDPHYARFEWFQRRRATPFLCALSVKNSMRYRRAGKSSIAANWLI
ncbi:hypothetical protein JXJ21_15305 [candidate division KSB1 bacterium]|nr:hypothetical protein [candidate division KSB1 bacterium]